MKTPGFSQSRVFCRRDAAIRVPEISRQTARQSTQYRHAEPGRKNRASRNETSAISKDF
jgi:hypothetical protein